jgi:hypothetical protein
MLTSNWNKMSSINCNHRCGRFLNWSHFIVENSSVNLGYNYERYVSNFSNLECVYFFVWNNRSSDIVRSTGWMNWNVSNST